MLNAMPTFTDMQDKIHSVEYIDRAPLTLCIITLKNGFMLVGQSACITLETYSQMIGERLAYNDAFDKIWQLEGYLLKQRTYEDVS